MSYCIYLLVNTHSNRTYLGITNNSEKRIRQHNCEIKGGAKYTRAFKGDGEWQYHFKHEGLTKHQALSIERTAKNLRRRGTGKTPIEKRMYVLLPLLNGLGKISI